MHMGSSFAEIFGTVLNHKRDPLCPPFNGPVVRLILTVAQLILGGRLDGRGLEHQSEHFGNMGIILGLCWDTGHKMDTSKV